MHVNRTGGDIDALPLIDVRIWARDHIGRRSPSIRGGSAPSI